jgi:hypothetical protein
MLKFSDAYELWLHVDVKNSPTIKIYHTVIKNH